MTLKVVYFFSPSFFSPEIKSGMLFVFFLKGGCRCTAITIFKVVALCFRFGIWGCSTDVVPNNRGLFCVDFNPTVHEETFAWWWRRGERHPHPPKNLSTARDPGVFEGDGPRAF